MLMKQQPLGPKTEHGARGNDLPAYVSNGAVGLRVREVALLPGSAIVSGVVGLHQDDGLEAAIGVPYPLAGDIGIGEAWLSEQPWATNNLQQRYAFATGELISNFTYHVGDAALRIEVVTFASRSDPSLTLQRVEFVSDTVCTFKLRAIVAKAEARGTVGERDLGRKIENCDGSILWIPEGGMSSCGIAYYSFCPAAVSEPSFRHKHGSGSLITEYQVTLNPGQSVRLDQIAAIISSVSHNRPREEAVRRLAQGVALGFDVLRERNRECWENLWKGRIRVEGASAAHQRLIDAGFFYLNSSAHVSSPGATSMFGLATWANYNYYYGHVMWDIDAFCIPPLLMLQPEAGQSLLDFRWRHAGAARANAKLDGHQGLRFPWQTAPTSGEEASPASGSAAANAAHASVHVARAFALHADITRNNRYLSERGWPVLSGVADWLASRMTITDRGAELFNATGPAEVADPPDNDAFTDGCTRFVEAHDTSGKNYRCRDTRPMAADCRPDLPATASGRDNCLTR